MKHQIITAGIIIAAAAMPFAAQAKPPHDHGEGVRLATDIVNLVRAVFEPAPTVIYQQPATTTIVYEQPATVVYPPVPASYEYRYYNGAYVVYYSGWYWFNSAWRWGGPGTPPPPPGWIPHNYRRTPPPPPPPPPRPMHRHRPPRPMAPTLRRNPPSPR